MSKLILLSDLWGKEKTDWVSQYTTILEKHFEVKYYDCCELGNISRNELSQEKIHTQFINGGIEKAVEELLQLENEVFAVIGFSIGGYIAWKACLSGLKTQHLFAVSSTRLRYETQKPPTQIELFYGGEDRFRPANNWFKHMKIKENNYQSEKHELYLKKEIAKDICMRIIKQTVRN